MASGSGSSCRRMPTRSFPARRCRICSMRTRSSARSISGRRTSRIVRPSITVLTFGWCGQGRRPGALVDDEDGHVRRHLEDRLQDPDQARASPGPLRGHEHHEIVRREVRAPIEARVVERAGQGVGVLAGQTRARLSVAHEEDPGVRVARGSLEETEQEVGRTHHDTPHGRTLVYTPRRRLTDQAPYLVRRRAWARMSGMRSWAGRIPRLPAPQARSEKRSTASGKAY